jgi:trimeric autotransporter adhesin
MAHSFDSNVSLWDTSHITSMNSMFYYAVSFQGYGIEHWNVSSVTDVSSMFENAISLYNVNLSKWDVSKATSLYRLFCSTTKYFTGIGLETWDTSSVSDMTETFNGAYQFNGNISSWDVSHVKSFDGMFWSAYNFRNNNGLHRWDISRATSMQSMFKYATSFHGYGVSNWNTSSVMNLQDIFMGATLWNENLSMWDVSHVTNFRNTFYNTSSFLGIGLDRWNTERGVTMRSMFDGATVMNVDFSLWNIDLVTDMVRMFANTKSFQGIGINQWNINSNDTIDTSEMFCNATSFNRSVITSASLSWIEDLFCSPKLIP